MHRDLARKLRKEMTDAERRLWSVLRYRQLAGFRFRRQQCIGAYIVDFFCPEVRLIVELDGGQHALQEDEDAKRTTWLQDRGYTVVRYWNHVIFDNLDGVQQDLADWLKRLQLRPPHPNPPPPGGREPEGNPPPHRGRGPEESGATP